MHEALIKYNVEWEISFIMLPWQMNIIMWSNSWPHIVLISWPPMCLYIWHTNTHHTHTHIHTQHTHTDTRTHTHTHIHRHVHTHTDTCTHIHTHTHTHIDKHTHTNTHTYTHTDTHTHTQTHTHTHMHTQTHAHTRTQRYTHIWTGGSRNHGLMKSAITFRLPNHPHLLSVFPPFLHYHYFCVTTTVSVSHVITGHGRLFARDYVLVQWLQSVPCKTLGLFDCVSK